MAHPTQNFNSYATATLSGDVANALSLLKRLTNPNLKKQRCGLLIPEEELQDCKVCSDNAVILQ